MINVADLLVTIGIKGDKQVRDGLVSTRKNMQEVASGGIWAKAAILGVFYAMNRMASASNEAGTSLNNFNAYTGQSAEQLQRFQYAGRQVGATADEIKSSIMGINGAMSKLMTTGQMPSGMTVIGRVVGGLDRKRLTDTTYMMMKLQEAAQKSKLPVGVMNDALASFGLSEGTIAAMRKGAFSPERLARAPVYTDKQTAQLTKMGAAWGNLGEKFERGLGTLNLKHGGQMIKDLSMISDKVLTLANSLAVLAKNAKFFEAIGKIFEGWGVIIEKLISVVDEFNKNGFAGTVKEGAKNFTSGAKDLFAQASGKNDFNVQQMLERADAIKLTPKAEALQRQRAGAGPTSITQNNVFNGVKGADEATGNLKAATTSAVRQSPALKRKD